MALSRFLRGENQTAFSGGNFDANSEDSSSSEKEPSDCTVAMVTPTASAFNKDPVNVNVETKSNLFATKADPENCFDDDGPTWSWSITERQYRATSDGEWVPDDYTPTIAHSADSSPTATLIAKTPKAGFWRFKVKVTATWDCWDKACTKSDETDWLELKVTNCDWTLELVPDDNFDGRSYSRVGVGETGKVKVVPLEGVDPTTLPPVTWECNPETCMTITGGEELTTDFAAKGHACTAKVCATIGTCKQCLNIDVVEPVCPSPRNLCKNEAYKHETSGLPVGVGLHINYYLTPTDVSFNNIKVQEQFVKPTDISGYFKTDGKNHDHKAWPGKVTVGKGNIETGCLVQGPNDQNDVSNPETYDPDGPCPLPFDFAGGRVPLGTEPAGILVWQIPWKYFVAGESKVFATVPQFFLWKHPQVNPNGMVVIKGTDACGAVKGSNPE